MRSSGLEARTCNAHVRINVFMSSIARLARKHDLRRLRSASARGSLRSAPSSARHVWNTAATVISTTMRASNVRYSCRRAVRRRQSIALLHVGMARPALGATNRALPRTGATNGHPVRVQVTNSSPSARATRACGHSKHEARQRTALSIASGS